MTIAIDDTNDPVSGVLCVACGYDLTGLSATANCPECGTPVRDSENPMLMRYSDLESLERVRLGLRLVFWVSIAVFVILLALMAAYAIWEWELALIATFAVSGLALLLDLFGWFLATTVLHRMPDQRRLGQLRFGVLVLLATYGALNIFESFLTDVATVTWSAPVAAIWTVVTLALFATQETTKLAYLKRLALFVPDWTLARRYAFLSHLILWTTLLFGLAYLALGAFDANVFTNPDQLFTQNRAVGVLYSVVTLLTGAILALAYYLPYTVYLYKAGNRVADACGFASKREYAKHYTEARAAP